MRRASWAHRPRAALLALCLAMSLLCAPAFAEEAPEVDFAGQTPLIRYADTVQLEVTVHTFVDGDTTHFNVPEDLFEGGILKARYLAVNTPESTGKIEEWGKKAARFTREKLESASAILIESDDGHWNLDSTGGRYLVWVWYKPQDSGTYRNLNIELLQNGLAIASSAGQNRYGDTCMAAIAQARARKLNVYSGEKDPDFFYGDAIELTIRELRLHPEAYEGKKVAFTGVITMNHNNSVFLEDFDEETGLYFGISAYYGFGLTGRGLDVLAVGNESRIVGTMQYYEAGHSWQVSGLTYRAMKPKDPGNIQIISQGNAPSWKKTTLEQFCGNVTLEGENGPETYPYAQLALGTSVEMEGLSVAEQYVNGEDSSLPGSRWLTCGNHGPDTVRVYVVPLSDEALNARLADGARETFLTVRGIVDTDYNGDPCIRVYTQDGLTILE